MLVAISKLRSYFKATVYKVAFLHLCDVPLTPPPPFKVVPSSFEHGLEFLADLTRGGGGITRRRSWTGQLSQNRVHYSVFCNWLQVSLTVNMTVNYIYLIHF